MGPGLALAQSFYILGQDLALGDLLMKGIYPGMGKDLFFECRVSGRPLGSIRSLDKSASETKSHFTGNLPEIVVLLP